MFGMLISLRSFADRMSVKEGLVFLNLNFCNSDQKFIVFECETVKIEQLGSLHVFACLIISYFQ